MKLRNQAQSGLSAMVDEALQTVEQERLLQEQREEDGKRMEELKR